MSRNAVGPPPPSSDRRWFWPLAMAMAVAAGLILIYPRVSSSGVRLKFNQTPPILLAPNNPALALETAFTQVAKAVSPAVVNISSEWTERVQGYNQFGNMDDFFNFWFYGPNAQPQAPRELRRKQKSLGSGFLITPDGYLLTNAHVVGKAEKITVTLENGKDYQARVVGKDEKTDIALLKIEAGDNLPSVPLGDSDAIQVGQWTIAIGNPFGLDHTLTTGVVSAKGRSVNLNENSPYASYIQTDASINPGNSGGPLCNLKGEVIGINSAIFSQSGGNIGIGFAIPANVARKVAQDLSSEGHVIRAGLGAVVQPLDAKLAESFGMMNSEGALLSSVNKGSAAEKAGLKSGDIVLEFNGERIVSASDLVAKLYAKAPGDVVRLSILRDKQKSDIEVVLQALSETDPGAANDKGSSPKGVSKGLGFHYHDPTQDLKSRMNPSSPRGPVVTSVEPDGPAAKAGVQEGDIILKVGDQSTPDAATLGKALAAANLRRGVRMFVWRNGVTLYGFLQSVR